MTAHPPDAPLHVVFLRDHLVPAGGTTYLLGVLPRFDPARVRPSLYVLQPRSGAAPAFEDAGVRLVFAGRTKSDPRTLAALAAWLRRESPDLVVLSGPKSMLLGGMLGRALRLPVVPRFNNMLETSAPMQWAIKRALSTRCRGIAVSDAARRWASERYGLLPERIAVVPSGHDVSAFPAPPEVGAAIRSELAIPVGAPVIAVIGRLVEQKGQHLMVDAMPAILHRYPDAVLLLVGDGPERPALAERARRLGCDPSIRMAGHRADVAAQMAAADLVVIPSLAEGFGFTALEAWAAGRPVVASASGGLAEILDHDSTGLIVTEGDTGGFVDAVLGVLGDRALADRLVAAGHDALGGYTVDAHVEALGELFKTIARRAGPAC